MKTLLVVYSRTGTTRGVGRRIARACASAMREIKDVRSRRGPIGYLRSGFEAVKARLPAIKPLTVDPSAYDLVILGAPVWAGHIAAPMRTFLEQNKSRLRRIALFCTMGRSGSERALREMAEITGQIPLATLALVQDEIKTNIGVHKIHRFESALHKVQEAPERSAVPQPEPSNPVLYLVREFNVGEKSGGPNPHA
jgi:flavodoxin